MYIINSLKWYKIKLKTNYMVKLSFLEIVLLCERAHSRYNQKSRFTPPPHTHTRTVSLSGSFVLNNGLIWKKLFKKIVHENNFCSQYQVNRICNFMACYKQKILRRCIKQKDHKHLKIYIAYALKIIKLRSNETLSSIQHQHLENRKIPFSSK